VKFKIDLQQIIIALKSDSVLQVRMYIMIFIHQYMVDMQKK